MSPIDIHVHGRKAVCKTFRHETLGSEVIALVKVVMANNMKNARIAFKTGRVKNQPVEEMSDPAKPSFRCFQGNTPHQTVNFISETQEMLRQVTAILACDAGN